MVGFVCLCEGLFIWKVVGSNRIVWVLRLSLSYLWVVEVVM